MGRTNAWRSKDQERNLPRRYIISSAVCSCADSFNPHIKAGYEFFKTGEKVNQLLFMDDLELYAKNEKSLDSLIQAVRIFSKDIGIEFGIEKCAMLVLKRGKVATSNGIKLPDESVIKSVKDGESYKYLGMLQADQIKHHEMKDKVMKVYKRRVRKILETKLNAGNLIKGINTWVVFSCSDIQLHF